MIWREVTAGKQGFRPPQTRPREPRPSSRRLDFRSVVGRPPDQSYPPPAQPHLPLPSRAPAVDGCSCQKPSPRASRGRRRPTCKSGPSRFEVISQIWDRTQTINYATLSMKPEGGLHQRPPLAQEQALLRGEFTERPELDRPARFLSVGQHSEVELSGGLYLSLSK